MLFFKKSHCLGEKKESLYDHLREIVGTRRSVELSLCNAVYWTIEDATPTRAGIQAGLALGWFQAWIDVNSRIATMQICRELLLDALFNSSEKADDKSSVESVRTSY